MRWLRGIAALAAMLAVIVGAPVVLLGWGGPGAGWWRAGDGSLLLTVLTLAGWVAWAVFALSTVAELVRYLSGNRFAVNLPLLGGLQAVCAGLVLAVVGMAAGSAAPAPVGTQAGPASPTPVAATPSLPRTIPAVDADDGAGQRAASPSAPSRSVAGDGPSHLVEAGDDVWTLAEQLLGDGRRWRELARLNPAPLADPTGELAEGTLLAVPAEPGPERVTVVRGDTLSGLALEHLGKSSLWPRIADANAELIEDPDHIEVGWELELPRVRELTRRDAGHGREEQQAAEAEPPAPAPTVTASGDPASAPAVPPGDGPAGLEPSAPSPLPGATAGPGAPDHGRDATGREATPGPDLALLGTLSALAAAGLMGGWQARRLLQHRARPPGRRVAQPVGELARFEAALGRRQGQDDAGRLDAALRAIGRHHHLTGEPLPALAQVTLGPDRLLFQWAEPAGRPPAPFGGDETAWILAAAANQQLPQQGVWHPCPYPALVSLGMMPGGETVLVDLEHSGVLGVAAESRELQVSSLAAMTLELGCAPWAAEITLVVVGGDAGLARASASGTASWVPGATGPALLQHRHAARSAALAGDELRRLRVDPDRAEAVAAEVFIFHDPLPETDRALLDELLSGTGLGISAVVPSEPGENPEWELFGDPLRPSGRLPRGESLVAHAVPEATREAVAALYRVAESDSTEPAPWWGEEDAGNLRHLPPRDRDEDPVDIVNLRRLAGSQPTLLLIGPIDLTGAAGPAPARARQQLIEMCTWLHEHPGRTATEMASGLGIAESTRRSNMSRLRSWLGDSPDGGQYLPDAYSGRIQLHAEVTSDVQRLRLLTGPGVNRISDNGLVSALDLVRGDVLADAAPGQWYWAEELRSDISSTLRDAGLVLVDRALASGDLDLARWAASRALVVAPDDELLLCARIRTEHAAGDRAAVERHVLRLSQQARALGVDLMPETVMLCQQVMEGRTRARRA
ncbi:MAG: LysM peptidoglycan-binding domain-containing protein [Propionicimonas sp.]|nr:LysM peptidoglycan-binding domain-containing protein [Propionicimonas sp.]